MRTAETKPYDATGAERAALRNQSHSKLLRNGKPPAVLRYTDKDRLYFSRFGGLPVGYHRKKLPLRRGTDGKADRNIDRAYLGIQSGINALTEVRAFLL